MGFPSFLVLAKTENLGHGEIPKSNSKLHWQENPEMPGEEGAALTYLSDFWLFVLFFFFSMIFLVLGTLRVEKTGRQRFETEAVIDR